MPTCALALLLAAGPARSQEPAAPHAAEPLRETVLPFLARHCFVCHGGDAPEAELDLAGLAAQEPHALVERTELWRRVRERLQKDEMPPAGEPRPAEEARRAVLAGLDALLPGNAVEPEPGRVTLRRLSRTEYENTVRDLLGVDFDAGETFPADEVGYGFDNVGDALSLSTLLFEKYLDAAERIAELALVDPLRSPPPERRLEGGDLENGEGNSRDAARHVLYSNGAVRAVHAFPRDGEYRLEIGAWAEQAGGESARLALTLDGEELGRFDVTAAGGATAPHGLVARVPRGEHALGAAFLNDYFQPDDPDPANRDRNLIVEWIRVQGPLDPPVLAPFQRELLERLQAGTPQTVVRRLAERAYRRPVTDEELEPLLALSLTGESIEESLRNVLVALLVSPRFLYRVELDPAPVEGAAGARDLDDFELATRLSYFLWSSLPDERLFELARRGELARDETLRRETERLLRDPRASALAESFAVQWLQLAGLERARPDAERFPAFDDELRASMRAESELFFEAVLREGRPVRELLEADFTFVDERLARHYGIPGVRGTKPQRVSTALAPGLRGGLLTQAGVLTVTSNPTRTSPVLRGKWILETLLGTPPPPPPPGVPDLAEGAEAERDASLRERLERHRADPACAACHAGMDPLGFALENYDAVGAWRERDGEHAIQASGLLPERSAFGGGQAFDGPRELRALLARDAAFLRALVEKLAAYAVGRGLEPGDAAAIDGLLATLAGPETTLPDIIHGLVRLDLFRRRSAEPGGR